MHGHRSLLLTSAETGLVGVMSSVGLLALLFLLALLVQNKGKIGAWLESLLDVSQSRNGGFLWVFCCACWPVPVCAMMFRACADFFNCVPYMQYQHRMREKQKAAKEAEERRQKDLQ